MKLQLTTLLIGASIVLSAQDFDGARPSGSSSDGVNLGKSYVTNIQFTHHTHSGSHGLLFNAYKPSSTVSGSLKATGNTKFVNNEGSYKNGAGAIMFFGNYGTMDFLVSDKSTGANSDVVWGDPKIRIKRDGSVGIGTSEPTSKLHISSNTTGNATLKIEADTDNNDENDNANIELIQDGGSLAAYIGFNSEWGGGASSIVGNEEDNLFRIGTRFSGNDDFNRLVINTKNGNVGIGTFEPVEKLQVNGNLKLTGGYFKYILARSNVTSEHLIAGHGQGSGWMINAEFTGSGNPQSNATYTVNPGQHNTSAGYLDYDGNGQRWTFFNSAPSEGVGAAVSFIELAVLDNSYISLSPTGNESDFWVDQSGFIGIGTTNPTEKLEVAGTVYSSEVRVDIDAGTGPDYVFEPTYNLLTLEETEAYIKSNKHLPEIPSAREMEANGLQLGEMNMLLLKKIEELTLHTIEQQKEIGQLKANQFPSTERSDASGPGVGSDIQTNEKRWPAYQSGREETEGRRGELEKKIEQLIMHTSQQQKLIEQQGEMIEELRKKMEE